MSETECVERLAAAFDWGAQRAARVSAAAAQRIESMRAAPRKAGSVESFFQSYGLDTKEGIALMCLAEALLRIPDAKTANALIHDKIARTEWMKSGVMRDDWMMRMAGLGLSVTRGALDGPLAKMGEPLIRKALTESMKILGGEFVLGRNMGEAVKNAAGLAKAQDGRDLRFSYDMLGEGARTMEDAQNYFRLYEASLEAIDMMAPRGKGQKAGISVKLSALYPRFEAAQEEFCLPVLTSSLVRLARKAAHYNLNLTVDAEESHRLELTLKILRPVIEDPALRDWDGLGLAVQSYGKRALPLVENLIDLARANGRMIQVRLVKGAYWDTEIKRAQMKGLKDYPVFTRKIHTDLCFLVCAQKLLAARDCIYPMFGTHNAHTVEAILDLAQDNMEGFEFQRLYGMGETLYAQLMKERAIPVRVYAPVGEHGELLPYLVRRLLENGANSSFVNKVFDADVPPADLARDPLEAALDGGPAPHGRIPLPCAIFPDRANAAGYDLDDAPSRLALLEAMEKAFDAREVFALPLVGGRQQRTGQPEDIFNPADRQERIGTSYAATPDNVREAFAAARKAFPAWDAAKAAERAAILEKIADLYEENAASLMMYCVREAGKTLADAVAELREAVDFCRYYAARGRADFDENGVEVPSYTGESNLLMLQGRGVFVCISPWNFPLAIFTGQVVAALMAGNSVIAKPAEQTPFTAQAAIALMHKAGVPENVLHFLPGDGLVGEMLVQHADVAGVAFTGSTQAAWSINRTLAGKNGPIVPLIAETGGLNGFIVDSSALTEQAVDDVIASAFGAAGQRCSAARILFVQEDVADKTIAMLRGAMAELKIGDPRFYVTDIGPLIDEEAHAALQRHKSYLEGVGKFVAAARLPDAVRGRGHYFAPMAYEIGDIADLKGEVFGPALHIIRYKGGDLPRVIEALNESGYGLTFGYHTRIDAAAQDAAQKVRAGNVYINRTITGAVVGVQPFGGSGLSGTGPKAGGPHYLHRFAIEKSISDNIAAAGGNAFLVMLEE